MSSKFPKQNEFAVNSLEGFFRVIFPSDITCNFFIKRDDFGGKEEKNTLWFRGHREVEWTLQPTLYRLIKARLQQSNECNAKDNFWKEIDDVEKRISHEFKLRSYLLLPNKTPENEYIWLSLMQHNNLSTRLLDWSEQASTALYFALSKYFNSAQLGLNENKVPCVWVLKPHRFKHCAMRFYNQRDPKDKQILENSGEIDGLDQLAADPKLTDDTTKENLYNMVPMPVLSPYNSDRIRAQTGTFIIFPKAPVHGTSLSDVPWNLNLENLPWAGECLIKILIISPEQVSEQLKQIGIKNSLFFPEIPNISSEIETEYIRGIHI